VVDASGNVRSVVATRDPSDPNNDLWWAHTGGGGGNFGVVTRYWMRSPGASGANPGSALPNPPNTVLLSGLQFSWADLSQETFNTLVRNFGAWHENNSAPNSPGLALVSSLALNHISSGSVSMFIQVEGTAPNPQQLLTDFVDQITSGVTAQAGPITNPAAEYGPMPELVNAQQVPWLHAARFLATNAPVLTNPTLRADHKSAYHRKSFTDADLATIYSFLTSTSIDNPNAMLLLLPYGGNINAVDPAATAFPHRSSVLQVLYQSFWSAASDDATNLAWVRDFYGGVYAATGGVPVPNDSTDGCYINYPDADLSDPAFNLSQVPWHDLYYKDNYVRLQQVKARWDPQNIFRHSQSIELPS
jgi:FAD/FMN-containing dehydrogenase